MFLLVQFPLVNVFITTSGTTYSQTKKGRELPPPAPPGEPWCVSSEPFSLLNKDTCLLRGHFAHLSLFLPSNITLFSLLCNLLFSRLHGFSGD